MNIERWMRRRQLTQEQAALILKVNRSEVSRYLNGRMPSPERMEQFQRLTDGAVKMRSWPEFCLEKKRTQKERAR